MKGWCLLAIVFLANFAAPKCFAEDDVEIVGQHTLTLQQGGSITLKLSDFIVEADRDLNYPANFYLVIDDEGDDYRVSGTTIIPDDDFHGTLRVKVRVSNGEERSDKYRSEIRVVERTSQNKAPIIAGQSTLNTFKNESITIGFSNLVVTDEDDNYPQGFSMEVKQGNNYLAVGSTLYPAIGYTGTLQVGVRVNDGEDYSNLFTLSIEVSERGVLQIVGQEPLSTKEEQSLAIRLSDIKVNDPDGKYPSGFTLQIFEGENYAVEGTTIAPDANFSGNLQVTLAVKSATRSSEPYSVLVVVSPVNDLPVFSTIDPQPVLYKGGSLPVASEVVIEDPDDEQLFYAEIGFDGYYSQNDNLSAGTHSAIRAVYDPATGVLLLVGQAPINDYQSMIRTVHYSGNAGDTVSTRQLYFVLNDGKDNGTIANKTIQFGDADLTLNIPTGFTPNNDQVNDTWVISAADPALSAADIRVRVFNRNGIKMFETSGLENPWDGKFNGELLPSDAYFYTIEVTTASGAIQKRGVITILR